jgi:alpha-tubulin suppressor-like RCC1 family protein
MLITFITQRRLVAKTWAFILILLVLGSLSLVGAQAVDALACNTLYSWGNNQYGALGNGTIVNSSVPGTVSNLIGMATVTSGNGHSLAVRSDGTVWAWGRNNYGQLGDGTNGDKRIPQSVSGLSGVIAIAAGSAHSLAVRSNGTVWAWGRNNFGQLGDGTMTDRSNPVQVTGLTDVVAVAAGFWHSMALRRNGTVYTWGRNYNGELGNGTCCDTIPYPRLVAGLTDVNAIACGEFHSIVLRSDRTVWAWGRNDSGQVGNGTNGPTCFPDRVTGLAGAIAIAGGGYHSLALLVDGTVRVWGLNNYGQLGNGTCCGLTPRPVPVTGLNGVTAIAGGEYHCLALRSNGTAWTWGSNEYGVLGNGTPGNSYVPSQVLISGSVVAVAGGYRDSFAILMSPPTASTALTATAGNTQVVLSWNASPCATSYHVKRSTVGGSGYATVSSPTVTSYADTGLTNGTTYYYVVTAVNSTGESGNSTQSSATPVAPLAAAPVFQAAGTAVSGTTSVSPTWPAHQSGDVALLIVESANQAISLSTPAGFVEIAGSPQGTGTAGGTAATRLAVFWKRATTSSESSPTVADSGNHQRAQIVTVRGAAASGNPWDVTAGGVAASAGTSVSIPGATTTVANTLVVAIVANATDTSTAQTSGWINANLTILTERADSNTTSSNGGGFGVATGVKASAGAYGATTATLATSSAQGLLSIALKP